MVLIDEPSTDKFNEKYYPEGGIKKAQESLFSGIVKEFDKLGEKVIVGVPKGDKSRISLVDLNKHPDLLIPGGTDREIRMNAREGKQAELALRAAKLDEGRSISYELKGNGDVVIKHVNLNKLIDKYEANK